MVGYGQYTMLMTDHAMRPRSRMDCGANAVHLPPILPAATATTEPCHFAGAPMDARNGK
jgi:hypothetical protein